MARLKAWLEDLLWETEAGGAEIYRVKGIVHAAADASASKTFTVQAVRELYDVC